MTISMQTSSTTSLAHFGITTKRKSNWRCRLKQSKSIRLRQWPARGSNLREHCNKLQRLAEVELDGGVSINHDYEGRSQRHRELQKRRPLATSGMRTETSKNHPQLISSKGSKSFSGRQQQQQQKHLKLAAGASKTLARKSVSALVMVAVALMMASSFFNANLVGHCNCDTLSGHNPFSGGRASRSQPTAAARVERRQHLASTHQVNLKLAIIESQHFGAGRSRPALSMGTAKLDAPNNKAIQAARSHDDFLRHILASHEKQGASNKSQRLPSSQTAGSSKAEFDLRQIMMMHEHAATPPASSPSKLAGAKTTQPTLKRPRAKILSVLPRDLLASSSTRILSILPSGLTKQTNTSSQVEPTAAQTVRNSPFSQRASAKNYLMGSILGMGKMLNAQPNSSEQQHHSTEASLTTRTGQPKSGLVEFKSRARKPLELLTRTTASARPTTAPPSDERNSSPSSTAPKEDGGGGGDQTKSKLGEAKKNSLMDGAADLAQAYIKDSFRDLLTLTQLPIFSGGPISTAPSELEPGGKKWLANKQAAEQIRGNKTNAIEDLLRYIYILGNVGVRRKRDPLRVLSSNSRPLNALTVAGKPPAKRPIFNLLDAATNSPTIKSILKLRPPNKLTSSRLSSLLGPASDQIKSRGVMWEMATDPTLAVTMMHLLERASVALPLGFLLMPFVRMTRHPLGGISLDRILPARASHRSVDFEELAKQLDMVDKILSRSMRPTHRDASSFMG